MKDQQLKVLQETIRNLQTQLLENKTKEKENLNKIFELEDKLKRANVKELLLKTKIVEVSKCSSTSQSTRCSESNDSDRDVVCVDDETEPGPEIVDVKPAANKLSSSSLNDSSLNRSLDNDEARAIGLISSFLVVHPFGADLESISSYVQQASFTKLCDADLSIILQRYNTLFYLDNTKWKFGGFERQLNSPKISGCD